MDLKDLVASVFSYEEHLHDIKRTQFAMELWDKTKQYATQIEAADYQLSESDWMHNELASLFASITITEMTERVSLSSEQAARYEDGFHAVLDRRSDGLYAIAEQTDGTLETFHLGSELFENYSQIKPMSVFGEVECSDQGNWIEIPIPIDLNPCQTAAIVEESSAIYVNSGTLSTGNGDEEFPDPSIFQRKVEEKLSELFSEQSPICGVSCDVSEQYNLELLTAMHTTRPFTAQELANVNAILTQLEKTEMVGSCNFDLGWEHCVEDVSFIREELPVDYLNKIEADHVSYVESATLPDLGSALDSLQADLAAVTL